MSWKDKFPKENRYFETENGILYNGNCIEIMKAFPEDSIDLIVTSPPYNLGIRYDTWDDTMPPEEYFDFVEQFLLLFKTVLKVDGRFAINVPYDINMKHTGDHLRLSLACEYYSLLKKAGLKYTAIVDLVERQPERVKYTAWGSWLSPSAPYIYNPKECVLIGYKEQWKKVADGESTIKSGELFKEITSGMWKYTAETSGLTVANFSMDLPYKAIQGLSYKNDIVLDCFAGSGTTLMVAEGLQRRWIGIEISKNYCDIIKKRYGLGCYLFEDIS